MGKNNACLPNLEPFYAAGIDPKTGLPVKVANSSDGYRKEAIKKQLRILDEQNAVNRYTWYNLPGNLTSQELERMLYYKGQLCFFYMKELNQFYFMPYALDGTIDFYGRFNSVHPVPMSEGTTAGEKKAVATQRDYLSRLHLDVVYDVPMEPVDPFTTCILLHDYTKQLSQTILPRQSIQDPLLDIMADCIPFMRTGLLNSTGVLGMRVNNQDEYSNVMAASYAIDKSALEGMKYVPIVGTIEFQEMTGSTAAQSSEFMQAMQSLDNYRLSLYGLDNGGLFQKQSHMLEAEQEMNQGNVNLVMNDGLSIRQHFCDVVNSIYGLGISCEVSEPVINADMNGDGLVEQDQDQSGSAPGEQPQEVSSNE